MAERIVVDPITRIEGHLRVEADIENGEIKNAFTAGTMVRGIELIVKDRDPRDVWAFVQRICGVCTNFHALASLRAVEDALDIKIPKNAEYLRYIMQTTGMVHDHIVHFYHLHALDWVDVVSALKADVNETSRIAQSISKWPKSSPGYFKDIQDKIKTVVESGQLSIFTNGYWGHSAYKLPPEVNLMAVAHYLEALDFQKELVKIHTIIGGKNPHPHFVVGGMATPIDLHSENALNAERLSYIDKIIDMAADFVNQVYVPDLMAIASFYKDWTYGGGINNYLSYGDYGTDSYHDVDSYLFPRGAILNGNLNEVFDVDPYDPEHITEAIDRAWYTYNGQPTGNLHPYDGTTELKYTGPKAPYKNLDTNDKYSWVKAPLWKGNMMEVGPLARMLVGYAKKVDPIVDVIDTNLKKHNLPMSILHSTLGRTAARGLEAVIMAQLLRDYYDRLIANIKAGDTVTFDRTSWEPSSWPKSAKGAGLAEVPRGGLGHWIIIEDGKVKNYQAVVPTTWNAAPETNGQKSAYEASLIGTPIADQEQPIEILRTVHSFDPCMACAVHMTDLEDQTTTKITIG
ncbi:nickel-dependent hydrogenase large subunit [Rubeoparvulum massiliense]|uniref:nickel-dependent hydrogenase large subunit n=1 Tax=Rubeoparvulum massiliense TaxID=1631346 RepID=UPI00065E2727|nr:nickel-dependent hydrogenase large subunit [Rubeoparvulum massiliense]